MKSSSSQTPGRATTGPVKGAAPAAVSMTPATRTKLIAFALLGLGASATSTYVHYQLLTDSKFISFCDVSSTVNCTQA